MKYTVLNKCYFRDNIYMPGEVVSFDDEKAPSRHFQAFRPGNNSTIEKLRKQCQEKKLFFETSWGVDRLRELLGIRTPAPEAEEKQQAQKKRA